MYIKNKYKKGYRNRFDVDMYMYMMTHKIAIEQLHIKGKRNMTLVHDFNMQNAYIFTVHTKAET